MARSFAPNDIIALPRLTAVSTARLLFELLKAASEEKRLPAIIAAARDELARARDALGEALKSRLRGEVAQTPVVRIADHVEDNAFGALVDWLRAFTRLPLDRHPEAALAHCVLDAVFPGGLAFRAVSPADEWREAETRLALIADEHHDVTIHKLGGASFLAEVKRAHKAYGEALGITKHKPTARSQTLREPLDNAHEALRAYVLRVSAHVRKSDPETAVLAGRLLSPLVTWRDRPIKVEEAPETKPAAVFAPPGV